MPLCRKLLSLQPFDHLNTVFPLWSWWLRCSIRRTRISTTSSNKVLCVWATQDRLTWEFVFDDVDEIMRWDSFAFMWYSLYCSFTLFSSLQLFLLLLNDCILCLYCLALLEFSPAFDWPYNLEVICWDNIVNAFDLLLDKSMYHKNVTVNHYRLLTKQIIVIFLVIMKGMKTGVRCESEIALCR